MYRSLIRQLERLDRAEFVPKRNNNEVIGSYSNTFWKTVDAVTDELKVKPRADVLKKTRKKCQRYKRSVAKLYGADPKLRLEPKELIKKSREGIGIADIIKDKVVNANVEKDYYYEINAKYYALSNVIQIIDGKMYIPRNN